GDGARALARDDRFTARPRHRHSRRSGRRQGAHGYGEAHRQGSARSLDRDAARPRSVHEDSIRTRTKMFDLTGKTALVTGASGGIGSDIARALHKQGAVVTLSGTRAEALEKLKAELGSRAHVAVCNLSDAKQVDELPKTAEGLMGGLDILVCN